MNESVVAMLSAAQNDLRRAIPSFDVFTLIGRNFDDFHRNPSHQRSLLAGLTGTHQAQIELAGHVFRLTANPVHDAAAHASAPWSSGSTAPTRRPRSASWHN